MLGMCNCDGSLHVKGLCPRGVEGLSNHVLTPQPPPVNSSDVPASWSLVIRDMHDRDEQGRAKYGVPLRPHNGRDQLVDSYQEVLDLAVYLRTAIYERDGR